MTEDIDNYKFYLKFILNMTIVQRDALSRGINIDPQIFRLIHWASSAGLSDKPEGKTEFIERFKRYAMDNPALKAFSLILGTEK